MVAIGMGFVFFGYAVAMWGYCLVRGYNVTFADVFKNEWPGGGTTTATAKTV
jgi:hypothetical protein